MPLMLANCSATHITKPEQMKPKDVAVRALKLSPRARELSEFLKTLPSVQHAFAYGSGIFQQQGLYIAGGTGPMLDFILAVDDPREWHDKVQGAHLPTCSHDATSQVWTSIMILQHVQKYQDPTPFPCRTSRRTDGTTPQ